MCFLAAVQSQHVHKPGVAKLKGHGIASVAEWAPMGHCVMVVYLADEQKCGISCYTDQITCRNWVILVAFPFDLLCK